MWTWDVVFHWVPGMSCSVKGCCSQSTAIEGIGREIDKEVANANLYNFLHTESDRNWHEQQDVAWTACSTSMQLLFHRRCRPHCQCCKGECQYTSMRGRLGSVADHVCQLDMALNPFGYLAGADLATEGRAMSSSLWLSLSALTGHLNR